MAQVLEFRPRAAEAPKEAPAPLSIPKGTPVWTCTNGDCGGQLFYILQDGYACSDCGGFRGMAS